MATSKEEEHEEEEQQQQELIPGLPDLLVTHFIIPRLPWYTRPRVLAVSKAWQAVFHSMRFFLRARTKELYNPTGLFLIHELSSSAGLHHHDCDGEEEQGHDGRAGKSPRARLSSQESDEDESSDVFLLQKYALEMWDLRAQSWHTLPPIPACPSGVPWCCSFVSLDKRLYVMGGVPDSRLPKESAAMHMLNLGFEGRMRTVVPKPSCCISQAHWWWEPCASMRFSRAYVKCVAHKGHIYVVGGTCPAEVYSVVDNQWHGLPDMVDVQFFCNGILALENRIFAYGYDIVDPDVLLEPDVNSARIYDILSTAWTTVQFDFSRCCTSASGHIIIDIVDGTLITYNTNTQNSTVFDGKLHDQVDMNRGSQTPLSFNIDNDYIYHSSCQVFDLVVVETSEKLLEIYTLVSPFGSRLHELWRGIIDFDACKVTWDQNITCPFKLGQLNSENLSEICYMS